MSCERLGGNVARVNWTTLRNAMRCARLCCSRDESRPALNSVLVETLRDSLRLVATDGADLVVVTIPEAFSEPGQSALLARRDVSQWCRLVPDDSGAGAQVLFDEDTVCSIVTGFTTTKFPKFVRDFPPYESVIPPKGPCDKTRNSIAIAGAYLGTLAKMARIAGVHNTGVLVQISPSDLRGDIEGVCRFDIDGLAMSITAVISPMVHP